MINIVRDTPSKQDSNKEPATIHTLLRQDFPGGNDNMEYGTTVLYSFERLPEVREPLFLNSIKATSLPRLFMAMH